ncbi:pyruvate:ferredoxin (flavodoxin) oxidoreductase [Anaerolineae bacterium CFX8]|nr:pyruvate:ferredoxin (flavodoxin) oxidoreductase [Anaerolineae bacterium CFX8]
MSNQERHFITVDANTAAAHVAHAVSEVIAIYPITPSSAMGELADEKSAANERNIWGTVPRVVEMQSEGGAAGAVHGALTTGALATTFTASQGLLLMIPNMYKIAGELTPAVFHVAARSLATHALSIFGDHSDVMAARQTGWALMVSSTVQEAMDLALVSHAASLKSRIPFVHFFDGFRTSHEIQKIEELTFDDMRAMIDDEYVFAHRQRGLNPEHPVMRGSAQDPDVFFQSRERANPFYQQVGADVQEYMDRLAALVGRQYHLFDYFGAPDADRVVVVMGSGGETLCEVADYLNAHGEKVGVLKVRLYRPFVSEAFVAALPSTVRKIAVLDRTKEPGAAGEPLYQDVRTALYEALEDNRLERLPVVVGGRYGLGSKEFDAGMAKAVFDNLAADRPKNNFTVGINDDVSNTSLPYDPAFSSEPAGVHTAMFYGLGADGTVGANKNTIKIIAKATDFYTQGYFVYDSKKSGSMTASHLRFSRQPIRSIYLVKQADFLACHNFSFLERFDMLSKLKPGGTFLLNAPYDADEVWQHLPGEVQQQLIDKKARFYVIDALKLAKSLGLGGRINTTMQAAFFSISGVLPQEQALDMIKLAIEDTYGDKGQTIVDMNVRAAMLAVERVQEVKVPAQATNQRAVGVPVPADAPEFVRNVTMTMVAKRGDELPVSAMPLDGTFPTGTSKYEKRNIAPEIPVWDPDICIQCNQCSYVCPHATIRVKIFDAAYANGSAPETFKSTEARGREFAGMRYTVQVAPEDCTGCGVCVEICPAFEKVNGQKTDKRAINMAPQAPLREQEAQNWDYFLSIPDLDLSKYKVNRFTVKGSQLLPPMFEFSGACSGCGETPYIKLISQLYGDHAVIANATGCSSIYGGNLPTTPYTTRADGRGPAWSNSLFEDNAEFGLGMRLTINKLTEYAFELLDRLIEVLPGQNALLTALRDADQSTPEGVEEQRARVEQLKAALAQNDDALSKQMLAVADNLIKKSVWIFGGDGWAYDIGYGGLDHVLASGQNVNIMVLDTAVYSNTGGQMSKATPRGAVAKFAAAGKPLPKKDLGLIAISYGNVYVAQIAMGANMTQAITAIREAEAYEGPSLIITYSHCIMQGIDTLQGNALQAQAVETGFWPLYRYNPAAVEGKNPFTLDSKGIAIEELESFLYKQTRFNVLRKADPDRAQMLAELIHNDVLQRWNQYQMLAKG